MCVEGERERESPHMAYIYQLQLEEKFMHREVCVGKKNARIQLDTHEKNAKQIISFNPACHPDQGVQSYVWIHK